MKSTKSLLFALFILVGQFTFQAYAVNDIVTVGATGSTYTTLKLAFDAINAGTLTGDIQLQIKDNTTETASAELISGGIVSITKVNAGTGYTSNPTVVISAPPTGGIQATATVSRTGDGINVFTITNPGAGYTSAPTISFTGGGGSGATATATLAANFTSVKIYPIVTNKIINGNVGVEGKALIALSGVNNVTFDGRLHDASGVRTGSTRDLTITNPRSAGGSITIRFRHNASNNKVDFCKIKGAGQSSTNAVITLNTPATISATGNYNNTISNNTFTYDGTRPFVMIYSAGISGAVNTGTKILDNDFENCMYLNANTIGISTYTASHEILRNSFYETGEPGAAGANTTCGLLNVTGGNNHNISNNYIGGKATQCGGGNLTKAAAANNIFKGIVFSSTDAGTASKIENNVIKNIVWNNSTANTASWTGISVENTHNVAINGNTIGNISVTNSTTGSNIIGINKTNGTNNQTISNNFIYGLTSTAASSGQLFGIYVSGGLTTLSNNIISLSHNNDVSTIGMYDHGVAGKTANWYFNTVRIGGTAPTSGIKGSYAFWSQALSNTRDFRNNIFVNARTNGGSPAATGSHYAAYFNYSANTDLTLSNNNYFVSGLGGVLGRYAGANVTTGTEMVTGKDAGSVSVNPGFAIPTGTAAVDYKPSDATLTGVAGTGITTDYEGAARSIPTMGAWEVAISLDVPGAPTIGTATAGNTQASVAFTAPASNGGSAITGYTVTSSPGDITGTGSSSPIVVTGLTNGTAYTFTVTANNAQGTGAASSASNSATPIAVPDAPTIGTATAGNAQASVAFTAPSNTGDSPITGYTVTSSPGGITGTGASSPIVVTGLTNGTAYTFTVTATNTQGTSVPSAASNSVTPATVPGAPTIGTATRGNAQASVTFTAPASNGGSAITGYTVTSSPGDITGTGSSSPIVVTGLTNGTAYTFTVTATNAAGTGAASLASNSVTPINDVPEIAAPAPPTRIAGDVSSIFSDAYTPIAGTTVFNPNWGQTTTVSNISVAGNTTMKYSTFNYEGTNLGSDLNLTTLGMTHIHFDVWSPDETLIRFSLIQRTPQSERPVNSTITPGTWNSIDIPISDFTSQSSFLVSAIYQLKIEGSGWYPTNTANRTTVYLDNIYFYKAVPGAPTSVVATAGNSKASVAFTAPSVTGASAISGYTVTSSPGSLTATGASSPLVVTGLTNGTAYTFTVTATNTQGTGAASAASNEVTPHATTNIIEVGTSSSVLDLTLTPVSDLKVLTGVTLTGNAEKTVNSITVESGGKLNVSSGSPLVVGTLTLKADKDASSFSSKLDAGITATTVRLFKTIDDTKWYFIAFPCEVAVAGITKSDGSEMTGLGTDWFIKYYDGSKRSTDGVSNGSNWVSVLDGTLTANRGYIIGLKNGTPDTELLFPLNTSILAAETESTVPVFSYSLGAAGVNHLGWNLVGQPYLSKYNANTNTGAPSFMVMPNVDGKTYTVTSKVSNTLPEVNPFAAYFVQSAADGNISFALTSRQNAPSSVANNVSENVQLNVSTATGVDNTYLIMDNDQTTDYQIGEDMEKWIGTGTDKPQVYTLLGGINYAFNALPMSNVVNLPLGFYTKTSGTSTISVNASQAPSLSKLLLTDISNGTTTDLLASDYNFIADAGTDNSRFVITAQRVSTDNNLVESGADEPQISTINGKLSMVNLTPSSLIRVYDATGRLVVSKMANNSSLEIPLSVVGLYTVQIGTQTKNWKRKIINKK